MINPTELFRFCLVVLVCGLCGCGGVRTEGTDLVLDSSTALRVEERVPVTLKPVLNSTDKAEYDVLGQYMHLKLAQVLQADGHFGVVDDDMASVAERIQGDKPAGTALPRLTVQAELVDVEQRIGSTVKIAIFSAQRQKVRVKVRVTCTRIQDGKIWSSTGDQWSSKGAWGVIAEVNRESLRKGEGIWKLDSSMVGVAAQRALRQAVQALPKECRMTGDV